MFVVYKYVRWSLELEQTIANMEVIILGIGCMKWIEKNENLFSSRMNLFLKMKGSK